MRAVKPSVNNTTGREKRDAGGGSSRRNTGSGVRKRNPLSASSPPTTLEVRGVRVHFPFRPYACQETYMEKVMDALLRSENALLESPTGTGKTLCLLCSTLAWQREQSRQLVQQQSSSETTTIALKQDSTNATTHMMSTTGEGSTSMKQNARIPTIIYASRTHSQLSQVVRELRNTRYRPKHAVLGSREQMCVHPKVKKANSTASDINHDCNRLGKERKCRYRNNLEGFTPPCNEVAANHDMQPVMDLEDLVTMGKQHKVCPFYYTRSQVENAELVLVPYNYLFDKDARHSTLADIQWDNAVVIFDEAHNLESFASDSTSFDLSSTDIAGCVSEIQRVMNYTQAMPDASNLNTDNLVRLKAIFLKLECYLLKLSEKQSAYSGEFMMNFFHQGAGITHANHEIFIDEVRKVNDMIMDSRGSGSGSVKLEHFVQCLKRVYGHSLESRCMAKAAFYRVYVSPKPAIQQQHQQQGGFNKAADVGRTISYWCFAPALAMEELANLKVRSILVTSGTLSPLPSYSMELGIPFPHTLENSHIVKDDQIHVRVMGKGVSGKALNSSYERRKDDDYYIELGNTLASLTKVIPAGVLVFFPSYSVMEVCLDRWGGPSSSTGPKKFDTKNSFFAARKRRKPASKQYSFPRVPTSYFETQPSPANPWKRLLSTKSVVVEPKSSADLPDAIAEFQRFLGLPKSPGCVLMGVCRGKISEGIDFAHDMSRAVVITGLPFPPAFDPKVTLKREFLDYAKASSNFKITGDGGFAGVTTTQQKAMASNKLSGHEWYTQQAHRAVNQAVGRVIRNKSDYGAVLLLDSRFDQHQNQNGLSKWLQPHVRKDEGFGVAVRCLAQFYKDAGANAAKKMAETENREANDTRILKYEDEVDIQDDVNVTMVAVIQSSASTSAAAAAAAAVDSTDEVGAESYVPPERVIARMDVKEALQHAESIPSGNVEAEGKSDSSTASDGKANNSRAMALEFMQRAKEKFSPTQLSALRKAVVAMKAAGDKKDKESFLRLAKDVVRMVLRCEPFEAPVPGQKMILLFFCLLPEAFQEDVKALAFVSIFCRSRWGGICKEAICNSDYDRVQDLMVKFLRWLWCSQQKPKNDEYIAKSKEIVDILKTVKITTSMTNAFNELVPQTYAPTTVALFNDVILSRKRELTKQSANKGPSQATDVASKDKSRVHDLKRKQPDAGVTTTRAQMPINPYMRKKPPPPPLANTTNNDNDGPSLSSCLESLESHTFVKKSPNEITETFQSNAPSDMFCPICSNRCTKPFIAKCNHFACLPCWKQWLQRSKTCPTCRVPVSKEAIALAVFT